MSAAKPPPRVLVVRITILGLIVAPCYADLPNLAFEVTAAAGPDAVAFPVFADWGTYDPKTETWTWILPETHEFRCEGRFLGSLDEFHGTIIGDPQLDTNFEVQSGPDGAEFRIASAWVPFDPPLIDPMAWVSVTFVLTDFDGDGATLTGLGPNGGAYLAQYNGWAGDPSGPQGTTFAECVFTVTAGPFETVTATCLVPPTVIPGLVYDMSTLTSFHLTATDMVRGVGSFVIVPCFGDLDGDGDIDLTDLAQLLANYGTISGASYHDGDLDGDGDVDLADLAALLAVYGTSCD